MPTSYRAFSHSLARKRSFRQRRELCGVSDAGPSRPIVFGDRLGYGDIAPATQTQAANPEENFIDTAAGKAMKKELAAVPIAHRQTDATTNWATTAPAASLAPRGAKRLGDVEGRHD
jgi:hypothetical protein